MILMLSILLAMWITWILGNLAAMAFVPIPMANFNGFRIYVPPLYRELLNEEEYEAIVAHEEGHRFHGHVWQNFLFVCFFMKASPERRANQELEADDYAARKVHPLAMASAIRRLGSSARDNVRARRLEILHDTMYYK